MIVRASVVVAAALVDGGFEDRVTIHYDDADAVVVSFAVGGQPRSNNVEIDRTWDSFAASQVGGIPVGVSFVDGSTGTYEIIPEFCGGDCSGSQCDTLADESEQWAIGSGAFALAQAGSATLAQQYGIGADEGECHFRDGKVIGWAARRFDVRTVDRRLEGPDESAPLSLSSMSSSVAAAWRYNPMRRMAPRSICSPALAVTRMRIGSPIGENSSTTHSPLVTCGNTKRPEASECASR